MSTASTTPSDVPLVPLTEDVRIPQLGFGVFQIPPEETAAAVESALAVGYRHIDTAQGYRNEREVAEGIARSGIDPDEVFVTSKLGNQYLTYDEAMTAIEATVAAFGGRRVDLFLLHWPLPTVRDFMVVWRAIEEAHDAGRFATVGVSNFHPVHLERLEAEGRIAPRVNQVEIHPYLSQEPLRAENARRGIVTEAWSPLAQGLVLKDPVIGAMAESHHRSPAQVVLRWHIQLGTVVIPKSTSPARMRENFGIFDFELSDDEMAMLNALNRDQRTGADPDTWRYTY